MATRSVHVVRARVASLASRQRGPRLSGGAGCAWQLLVLRCRPGCALQGGGGQPPAAKPYRSAQPFDAAAPAEARPVCAGRSNQPPRTPHLAAERGDGQSTSRPHPRDSVRPAGRRTQEEPPPPIPSKWEHDPSLWCRWAITAAPARRVGPSRGGLAARALAYLATRSPVLCCGYSSGYRSGHDGAFGSTG